MTGYTRPSESFRGQFNHIWANHIQHSVWFLAWLCQELPGPRQHITWIMCVCVKNMEGHSDMLNLQIFHGCLSGTSSTQAASNGTNSWLISSFAKWHFQMVGGHWTCLAGSFNFLHAAILKVQQLPKLKVAISNWYPGVPFGGWFDPTLDFIDFQIGEFLLVPDQSEILSPHFSWWWNQFHQDVIRFDIPGLFQVGMKHKWMKRCFSTKTRILSKRSHVSCSFMNQESGQLAVSRLGAMHSAGLNPTDSEVGGSFCSIQVGGGSEVLPRSGVQG